MPVIRPVSDLRNNFTEIESLSRGQPVFLTKNGVGTMVVLSMEDYDRQVIAQELAQMFSEIEADIANGDEGFDYREVMAEVKKVINERGKESCDG